MIYTGKIFDKRGTVDIIVGGGGVRIQSHTSELVFFAVIIEGAPTAHVYVSAAHCTIRGLMALSAVLFVFSCRIHAEKIVFLRGRGGGGLPQCASMARRCCFVCMGVKRKILYQSALSLLVDLQEYSNNEVLLQIHACVDMGAEGGRG